MAWPSQRRATLLIDSAKLKIDLPVMQRLGKRKVAFEPPEHAEPGRLRVIAPARESREIHHDVESQKTMFTVTSDDGRYVIEDTETEISSRRIKIYEIGRDDPSSAVTRIICHQEYRRSDWRARVDTEVEVTCDETHFHITGTVRAFEGERPFASRDFAERIRRDHL